MLARVVLKCLAVLFATSRFLGGKDSPRKREIPPPLGFLSFDRKRKALRAAGIPALAAKDQSIIPPVS
jgi:hypothetical protein